MKASVGSVGLGRNCAFVAGVVWMLGVPLIVRVLGVFGNANTENVKLDSEQ